MQVKNIAVEHSAMLLTCTKLPPVFKTFVLSIFEWPLKTGFTVHVTDCYTYRIGISEIQDFLILQNLMYK